MPAKYIILAFGAIFVFLRGIKISIKLIKRKGMKLANGKNVEINILQLNNADTRMISLISVILNIWEC